MLAMETVTDNIFGRTPFLVYKAFQYVFSKLFFLNEWPFFMPHIWQEINGPFDTREDTKKAKGRASVENKLPFLIRGPSEKEKKN